MAILSKETVLSVRDRNRCSSLKGYLSRHSKKVKYIDQEGNLVILQERTFNLEKLDLDELEYVTRIPERELESFLTRLSEQLWLWQEKGTLIFHIPRPVEFNIRLMDINPNLDFDKHRFDWYKRNTVPAKVKLSKD